MTSKPTGTGPASPPRRRPRPSPRATGGGAGRGVRGFVRGDGERINALLRLRPGDEPPPGRLPSAVGAWPADDSAPAWHVHPRMRNALALVDSDPSLFAAYERIRIDAQEESIRIVADGLGIDDVMDLRPTVGDPASGAGDLAALVKRAYDALIQEAAAASASTTGE